MTQTSNPAVFQGFTRTELEGAFDAVKAPGDWKNPISAWVSFSVVLVTFAAITFFTGVAPTIAEVKPTDKICRLDCVGYRAGPCGDH